MIASTPPFVIIPESTALAGEGATGCAVGSQPCKGNIPAFPPKPIIIIKNMISNVFSFPFTSVIFNVPPAVNVVV